MITSKNYTQLLIQVSLSQFTFLVKSQLSNEITSYQQIKLSNQEAIEQQLEEVFSKYEELRQSYDDILVFHDSRLNTFVPQAIFDENALGTYLQFTTKVFSTDFFSFDNLDSFEMNNVYVPFMNINNFLIDKFGAFHYHHLHTPLINQVLDFNKNQSTTRVYTHIQDNHFEIVVAKNSKLQLFNTYSYQTPEDFIYYLLFTYEQLQLNPDEHQLILFGTINKSDNRFKIAYEYIRNIEIKESKAFLSNNIESENAKKEHFILLNI
ncbi:DUF3822 family protein [Myroides guanonis]|uniref:DUF3822 domain-containing protein n=1 Tax=Myroides guanonis TaxID=1150112 RepID=A0A1I3QQ30_9FLAO|nr:DUF3822 family protein [Myroides guanonis]SFJ35995.1 Protein of unknown function [Myroides guanonis]